MDDFFRIPGTRFRLGLNPIFDLIPVFGDSAAALISGLTLFVAARSGLPKIVIARMGVNILLAAMIGIIPGIGEAFVFWFRPSRRNYQLLNTHLSVAAGQQTASSAKDFIFVIAVITGVLLVVAFCVAIGAYLFLQLLHGFK